MKTKQNTMPPAPDAPPIHDPINFITIKINNMYENTSKISKNMKIHKKICTLNIRIMDSKPLAVSDTCVMCCQAQLTYV